jgi:hypothetical protein
MSSATVTPVLGGSQDTPLKRLIEVLEQQRAEKKNVVNLLVKLLNKPDGVRLRDGAGGQKRYFTVSDWVAAWPQGGKDKVEGSWRVSANSKSGHKKHEGVPDPETGALGDELTSHDEILEGLHEWIPTACLGYVLESIQTLPKAEAIAWLELAVNLRTPTRNVIFCRLSDQKFHGHVGSIYMLKDGKYSQCTDGTVEFHAELGVILKEHLGPLRSNLHGFRQDLTTFIDKNVWKGKELPTHMPSASASQPPTS